MTKTLTEQWNDGTLEQKYYYVKFDCKPKPFVEIELKNFLLDLVKVKDRDNIEVLAAVPTYAEFVDLMSNLEYIDKYRELVRKTDKLTKQLAIATKALKEYGRCENGSFANKALALIKEVK